MADTGEVLVAGTRQTTTLEQTAEAFRGSIQDQLTGGPTGVKAGDRFSQLNPDLPTLPNTGIFDGAQKLSAPTPQEVSSAQKLLDGQVSKLFSPQDQQTLTSMQDALLSGDAKAFAAAFSSIGSDPERRKAFIDEMNKNLDETKAGTHVCLDHAGNVVVYDSGNKGVEIAADGTTTVHKIEHSADGTIVMKGEILNADGGKVLTGLGNDAVNCINHPIDVDQIFHKLMQPKLEDNPSGWPHLPQRGPHSIVRPKEPKPL